MHRVIGNVQVDYKMHFLPELRAVVNLGYDLQRGNGTQDIPVTAASNFNTNPSLSGSRNVYASRNDNLVFDSYLNYVKQFGESGLKLDVTGGYSFQSFRYRSPELPAARSIDGTFFNATNTVQLADDRQFQLLSDRKSVV